MTSPKQHSDFTSITLVDLDGTLVKGNTWPHFARLVLGKSLRRLRLRDFAAVGSMLLLRRMRLVSHVRVKRCVMLRSHSILNQTDIEAFARAMSRLFNPEVTSMLDEARREGAHIVLATAAAGEYAPLIAREAGISTVLCTPRAAKGVPYAECRGERKADAAESLAGRMQLPVTLAITDHPDDMPLFRRFPDARHILVK